MRGPRRGVAAFFALTIGFGAASVLAEEPAPPETPSQTSPSLQLVSDPFNEILRPAAKISGARFLGFLAAPAEAVAGMDAFRAWIPADWSGSEICLRVMSADGLYESANLYRAPEDWAGGAARLDYPTRKPEALAERSPEELALSVTRGDCAEAEAAEAEASLAGRLESGEGEEGEGEKEALLLINAFRAEQTYVEVEGRPEAPEILCAPVQAEVRMAYDTVCRVPAEIFEEGRAELIVLPVKNGELGREIPLTLRFGPLAEPQK
ncbi:hypothetical protein [Neomegalonema perideroedes]|uniref:hypothetical protein n=1 Tax=Neomegalonema perideroedes TaxID=217219 RepID=UPI00036E5A39|nr:hypothetical protein [Neomegalonema perideroedes]